MLISAARYSNGSFFDPKLGSLCNSPWWSWLNLIIVVTSGLNLIPGGKVSEADRIPASKRRELAAFLFLTVVLAPAITIAIVGGFGFAVWAYQIFAGPPGPT